MQLRLIRGHPKADVPRISGRGGRRSLDGAAGLLADHATPSCEALGRMLVHPFGELRRAHQAGLHRDLGEIRGRDDLIMTVPGRHETAEHGNDLDPVRLLLSLRRPFAPPCRSPVGSLGGKMLS